MLLSSLASRPATNPRSRMCSVFTFAGVLAILTASPAKSVLAEPDHCAPQKMAAAIHDLQIARDAARQIVIIDLPEGDPAEVPPEAIKQIQAFKNALHTSLDRYFACETHPPVSKEELETALYAMMKLPIPPPAPTGSVPYDPEAEKEASHPYLKDVRIEVTYSGDSRHLIGVLTDFEIPYGGDAILNVYGPAENGRYESKIYFTSHPYESIIGGFLSFDYKLSPPDAQGHWFVAATHINPWPTSCWQNLYVDVIRPEDSPMFYVTFHQEMNGYICTDDEGSYLGKVTSDSFQFHFNVRGVDAGILISPEVFTYRLHDRQAVRIQPVAVNPVNFVDVWLRNSWTQASRWSDTSQLVQLSSSHHVRGTDDAEAFVSARRCTEKGLTDVNYSGFHFLVRQTGETYTMLQARRSTICAGRNVLAAITDQ
jgi:hypothetical protein